jgi:hypothetical protein
MAKKALLLAVLVAAGIASLAGTSRADLLSPVTQALGSLSAIDPVTLFAADDPVLTDPAANEPVTDDPPHFPKGGKFKLFGSAKDDTDPENPYNEVISFDTRTTDVAGAFRKFGDHVKINELDDMVELKYYYVGRSCGGGSTRVQLGIDRDGNGTFDGNAFGYVGDKPFGGGCVPNTWVYEDMTNGSQKWDLSQLGGSMTMSWDQMEAFLNTVYPNHRVVNFVLVDDSGSFVPTDKGCAYFDLVSAGPRTLTGHEDTSDGHTDPNNC